MYGIVRLLTHPIALAGGVLHWPWWGLGVLALLYPLLGLLYYDDLRRRQFAYFRDELGMAAGSFGRHTPSVPPLILNDFVRGLLINGACFGLGYFARPYLF